MHRLSNRQLEETYTQQKVHVPTLDTAAKGLLPITVSVPLLPPVRRPRRWQEEQGPVCLVFLFIRFCFPHGNGVFE